MHAILAHGRTCGNWETDFGCAARLAALMDATLTGTLVFPTPYLSGGLFGTTDQLELVLQSIRDAERRAFDAGGAFEEWARGLGVRNPSWQVAEGTVPGVMRHLGNWHDLLVLRNDRTETEAAQAGATMLECGIPTLVIPAEHPGVLSLDCIAVAWNGSAEAVRAIHAARPLLRRAKRIVMLSGEIRDRYSEIGWLPQFDVVAYLRSQGLSVVDQPLRSNNDAGPALLDAAAAVEANLLVMGGYGRSRFSEWIFGGATRHVLSHAVIPVLMRH